MLDPEKNDSCLSVSAPSPIFLLPRPHPQFLTLSCGGAHILLTSRHRGDMRIIFRIRLTLVRHLTILGALALFQLY